MAYGTAKVDTLQTSTKTVQVDDLAVSADLGTAAAEDVGTAAGNVVQLDGSARLPAVDGSQLTGLPSATGTDLSYTASTRVLASSTGADATLPEATTSEAGLLSAADKTKLNGIAAADAAPQPLGVAAVGVSTDYAREDHVHTMPSAGDVGADPAGTASSAVSSHVAAADPHPGYALESSLAAVATSGAYGDLSGTPTIPVAADATPQALGTAAIGTSADYAREDHVHQMPSAANVGADPAGTATSAVSSHEAAADPHPGYALESSLGTAAALDVGTSAGNVVQLDGSGALPAVDGSNLTGIAAGGTPGGTTGQVQYNDGGSFAGDSGLTYDATSGALTVGGKTVTADAPIINLSQTWNNAAVTFTGLKLNVTNTASAGGSSLLDLQLNGSSAFKFDGANRRLYLGSNDYAYLNVSADGYIVSIGNRYGAGSGFLFKTDLIINANTSGILFGSETYGPAIRLGTVASPPNHVKLLNVANPTSGIWLTGKYGGSYAASTGYHNGVGVSVWCGYGAQPTDANANGGNAGNFDVWLNAGGAGKGTGVAGANGRLRVMNDDTDTEVFGVEQSGVIQVGGERLIANLPSSPTAGMITRVTDGDSGLTFGNTVVNSGAGATPYLCWYNGTNWTVIGA